MNYRNLNPWDFMMIPIERREKERLNICGGVLHNAITCSDDDVMQKIKIRKPLVSIDFSEFKKTKPEKDAVKRVKKEFTGHSFERENKRSNTFAYPQKLIVYLSNEKKSNTFQTTRSFMVSSQAEINSILFESIFFDKKSIKKVFLNNKKYQNA